MILDVRLRYNMIRVVSSRYAVQKSVLPNTCRMVHK